MVCPESDRVLSSETMDDDRLSELPDSLILTILSLLDMRDVVRTTLLSKRWKNRWTTVPCLHFHIPLYCNLWVEYSNLVSGALAQWKGAKILEFTIFFPSFRLRSSSDIDSWLRFAIEKQVEKLTVGFDYQTRVAYFLPHCLYSCSSITDLSLYKCSLKIEKNVQWNQLKRLEIRNPDGLSGDAMNQILVGAPLLEELFYGCFEIRENFNIRSTSLKMLEIGSNRGSFCRRSIYTLVKAEAELRIWAPNLLSLEMSACFSGSCLLYVPSLTTATLRFDDNFITREAMAPLEMFHQVFRSIRHVENVSLSYWSFQFLVDMKENHMPVEFPNAEFLKIRFVKGHEMLDFLVALESFPKLKSLIVYQYGHIYNSVASEMASLSPSLLHLQTVEIYIHGKQFSISPLLEYLLENAHVLQKMLLRPYVGELEVSISALKELLEMRRSSPYAEVIIKPTFLGF
ncbi:F-box/LRR-repeat protein At3g26922-like [Salvia miltiorrhiza]|uniref:F-box/LRR-repeat protein At3g26922-like n=1 Tax=Salvia miltiorrhiza TaxID=226208 RepID=UPI0025AB6DCD|nr:F-box/LRR-repeat protein At3g26922-like [Salvia miltiorrhiza]